MLGVIAAAVLAGSEDPLVMVAYSRAGSYQPRSNTWSSGAWSGQSVLPTLGDEAFWLVLRECPGRDESVLVAVDDDRDIGVMFRTDGVWSSATEVTTNSPTDADRAFDAAYESTSGDLLVAYWNSSTSRVGWRSASDATLSPESSLVSPNGRAMRYVALTPKPGSDEMVLMGLDTKNDLFAWKWNGSAFGSATRLSDSTTTSTNECFSAAYESLSGAAIAVYTDKHDRSPQYRTFNGASWSSAADLPATVKSARWVRLVADPVSDRMLCAILDKNKDIVAVPWTGSAWGAAITLETDAKYSDARQFDIAYGPAGGTAVVVWSEKDEDFVKFRTWNGSAWSAERRGPSVADQPVVVQLRAGLSGGEVFMAVSDTDRDLALARWTGTAWGSVTTVENSLGGSEKYESFMVCPAADDGFTPPRVVRWTETDPR